MFPHLEIFVFSVENNQYYFKGNRQIPYDLLLRGERGRIGQNLQESVFFKNLIDVNKY